MNLHRTAAQPEWESIPASKRSVVQKIASATRGIATPPNLITVLGLGLVIYGLGLLMQQQLWLGIVWVSIGRLLDLVDGMVAQASHTKSPLGELFDATADKIGTFLTIIVFILAHITPWWVATILALPQLLIALLILIKKRRGEGIHPTRPGKLSMAALWVAAAGIFLTHVFHEPLSLMVATIITIAVSILLGLYAFWQYAAGRD